MAVKYKKYDENSDVYRDIQERSRELKSKHIRRNVMFDEYERMFNMDYSNELRRLSDNGASDTIKPVISPTARNKVLGTLRLLISQDPKFTVKSDISSKDVSESQEKFISTNWKNANGYNGRPLTYDILLSHLLYGESHVCVDTVSDMAALSGDDARLKRIIKTTPFMFEVFNPKTGYPEFDRFGLSAYLREIDVERSWVRTTYGDLLKANNLVDLAKGTGKITLRTFWDTKVWAISLNERMLLCEEHGLPFIPVSVTMSEGSNLFDKPEDNRQPMLYGLAKSKLWERQNMYLTVLTSNMFSLGCMPTILYSHEGSDEMNLQERNGIQFFDLPNGAKVDALTSKGVLTTEMQNVGVLFSDMIDQSTVYNSAFGESGGNANFSEASLLSMSARLPLVSAQRQGGAAIAQANELAMLSMKERKINFKREGLEINFKDIPDDFEITCRLDTTQPQERLQRANEASILKSNGLTSLDYIQEQVLGIDNTTQMNKDILKDDIKNALKQVKIQELVTKEQTNYQQEEAQKQQTLQNAVSNAQSAKQQAVQGKQQGMDMGGAQNIPAGQQIENQMLQQIQQQAMMNNINQTGQTQMPEGQAGMMGGGGVAGGMPPEMGGLIPGQGGG